MRFPRRRGVLAEGVCLRRSSGAITLAPYLGILGRGVFQVHGQWGQFAPALRKPLGAAVFVSRQPRNRVGLCSSSRQHSRYQLEWHVHRIGRYAVDRRGVYGAPGTGSASESGLFRETHRARTRHGGFREAARGAARTTLSRSSRVSFQPRLLSSFYTMLAAASFFLRAALSFHSRIALSFRKSLNLNEGRFGTAFEVA